MSSTVAGARFEDASRFTPGIRVRIDGLKSKPELNGTCGTAAVPDTEEAQSLRESGRVKVKPDKTPKKPLSLKPANLTIIESTVDWSFTAYQQLGDLLCVALTRHSTHRELVLSRATCRAWLAGIDTSQPEIWRTFSGLTEIDTLQKYQKVFAPRRNLLMNGDLDIPRGNLGAEGTSPDLWTSTYGAEGPSSATEVNLTMEIEPKLKGLPPDQQRCPGTRPGAKTHALSAGTGWDAMSCNTYLNEDCLVDGDGKLNHYTKRQLRQEGYMGSNSGWEPFTHEFPSRLLEKAALRDTHLMSV